MSEPLFAKLIESLSSRHTYTEAEVRLVMAGMQAEIDRVAAERDALRAQVAEQALQLVAADGQCVELTGRVKELEPMAQAWRAYCAAQGRMFGESEQDAATRLANQVLRLQAVRARSAV